MSLRFQSVFVSTLSFASTRLGVAPQLRMPLERRICSWSHQIQRRIQQWIELDDLHLETILSLSVLNQGPSDSAMISACGVFYTPKADLSAVQVAFFGRLTSLQTIIQFMGVRVSDDGVLRALTTKLGNIAINLNMAHPKWPFSAEDEGEVVAAIAHIESILNSGQPPASGLATTEGVDQAALNHAKSDAYAPGSSMQINAQNIQAGTVGGHMFSYNTINAADPAVRQGVDTLVEYKNDAETIKKREDFLNWISKLDFQAIQHETFAKHAAGTGDWFLKHQDFVDWKDGKTRFLWCPGIPGAGKTILSQSCLSQSAHPSITELFTALQTEVLLYSQVYIVVDALDECSESNQARKLFFSTHDQGLWSLPGHVHLLITSRDILSISQEFDNMPRIFIEAHNQDLETYIQGRVTTDIKLKRLVKEDMALAAEIVEQIILKAAGMFLQAQLHLDALATQLNRKGLRTALALLPKKIMNSYDDAMSRIKAQGEAEYELACQIFYWLAYAKQPLSIAELQHAVAVSDDMTEMDFDAIVDVDMLTGICAGLIVIQEESYSFSHHDKVQIVQLVHYTTQEYLQLRQQQWFPNIHYSMAVKCLTYLSFNIFNSTSGDISNYPLYQYTSHYWAIHAKEDEATTMEHIFKFLEKENNVAHAAVQGYWPTHKTVHILSWFGLDQTLAQLLLQDPTHATSINEKGYTPLSYAAQQGHSNIVQLLLDKNVDPDACNKNQCTPLSYAAQQGHSDIVQLLLDKNADPDACDKDQCTPLSYAALHGHRDVVQLLLDKNADPDACDKYQRTPLSYAAQRGHRDVVQLLLDKNADPHACDKDQHTPLSYAAQRRHSDIVQLLLDKNADPHACDKDQRTPLSYAALHGRSNIVQLLLDKNADPDACDKDQHTPLSYAALHGHSDIVQLLLDKNADPDACTKYQRTPLSYAAEQGHSDVVQLLLDKNADPDACDKDQCTPLSYAAEQGHSNIVQLLLDKNADPDACDKDQCTPLSYAAEQGHSNIVQLLLDKNADPHACDKDQRTPLSYAAEQGHRDIVQLLLDKNADPHACDKDQRTPLPYAAEGHRDVVHLLLDKNVDPHACDKD
ncbi:ankyrin repeat-containing domain protein [Mycena floridula]|nr:ankyrin repeat-containing domain protein [Mycena floridula]